MNTFRKALHFHRLDNRKPLLIFWSILLLADLTQLVFIRFYPEIWNTYSPYLFSQNYVAIVIYVLVSGILTATNTFPLMMSFGCTRQNYYRNAIAFSVLQCAGMALIQNILVFAGSAILRMWDNNLVGNTIPFLSLWYSQLTFYLFVMLMFILLGTVFYRFGTLFGLIMIAFYIMMLNLIPGGVDILDYFDPAAAGAFNPWIAHLCLALSAVLAGIGWLLYRRASVRTY